MLSIIGYGNVCVVYNCCDFQALLFYLYVGMGDLANIAWISPIWVVIFLIPGHDIFFRKPCVLYHFSVIYQHWSIAGLLVGFTLNEGKDNLILQSQCRGCWWPGATSHQGISSHDIDLVWRKKRTFPLYIVNVMAADDLATGHQQPWYWPSVKEDDNL